MDCDLIIISLVLYFKGNLSIPNLKTSVKLINFPSTMILSPITFHPLLLSLTLLHLMSSVLSCHITHWTVSPHSYMFSTINVSWHTEDYTCLDTVLVTVSGGVQDLIVPFPATAGEVTLMLENKCQLYSVRLGARRNSSGKVMSSKYPFQFLIEIGDTLSHF